MHTSLIRPLSIAAAAILTLTLAACGGDDDGSGLSDAQAAAAQSAIESAAEDGITLDQECVEGVSAQLSEADAELAAQEDDAELSPEGEALTIELIECASQEDLADVFIEQIGDVGLDEDCARDALAEFDIAEMIRTAGDGGEPPAGLVAALEPCFGDGG